MAAFIAVAGAAPGVGKSTLCSALTSWLSARGRQVDHFREEEVFTRAEFAAVASEFKAGGVVQLSTLRAAVAEFVSSVRASGDDIVVADSLVPFVPSLLAWGHSEEAMTCFLRDLAGLLRPVNPILVYLDGEPNTALARAADREAPGWLDWFIDKLAGYRVSPAVHDLETATNYLRRERDVTLRLIANQPWRVLVIDRADRRPPIEVQRLVQDLLAPVVLVADVS